MTTNTPSMAGSGVVLRSQTAEGRCRRLCHDCHHRHTTLGLV